MNKFKIILATTSPHRQKAFEMLELDFAAEGSDIDEDFEGRPTTPDELVKQLSKLKAESVAKNHSEGIIVGFDSVGWFDNSILEKPKSREESFNRLQSLSSNSFNFYTGVHIINVSDGKVLSRVVKTTVEMRELTDAEIDKYLDQDPKYNTYALGFDPLGHFSSSFVEKIEGSYNNLLRGIPLEVIVAILKEMGIKI